MNNKLGNVISRLRKEKGITQKDLADALNISDKAISRWECGTSRPTLEMMFQISKYFKVSYNDLITSRISDNHEDDKIVEEIVKEFSEMGKKKVKRIKQILLFAIIIILILTIGIIFTNTYNRFKVYNVGFEGEDFYQIKGAYIETNIRDTLYLGDIELRDYVMKENETLTLDIYLKENGEEKILQTYSSLDNVYLVGSQSYVEIKNLSKYSDNLYLRVLITDSNNKIKTFETKLEFTLDFSNNKIYYNETFNLEKSTKEITDYNEIDIKNILLDNGFEYSNNNVLYKNSKNYKINYLIDTKIINYNFEKDNYTHRYTYRINENILEVSIYDDNLTMIENYKYDVENNKMNCMVGKCNDYKNILKILDEKVLYLFE